MCGRAVWDLRKSDRVTRSVRSLRPRRTAPAPAATPAPAPAPGSSPAFAPVHPGSVPWRGNPVPFQAHAATDSEAEMHRALWYAIGLDSNVRDRIMQLLEQARKDLGYAPAS